jgi:hypothetical protein
MMARECSMALTMGGSWSGMRGGEGEGEGLISLKVRGKELRIVPGFELDPLHEF